MCRRASGSGRAFNHPHSLIAAEGALYVCESARMMVRGAHGYEIHLPRGYLRGLAARNGYLFVGSTKGRNRSKSTGVLIDNAADPGESYGEPGVSVYNRDTEALDCFIDLSAYA